MSWKKIAPPVFLAGMVSFAGWLFAAAASPSDVDAATSGAAIGEKTRDAKPLLPGDVRRTLDAAALIEAERMRIAAANLANLDTPGYKARRIVVAADVLSTERGGRIARVRNDCGQGKLKPTGRELDLAIHGRGFFQVAGEDGELYYTRRGDFELDADGMLVLRTAAGNFTLQPPISYPSDAKSCRVTSGGVVSVQQPGQTEETQIGQLQLALFLNCESLRELDAGLFEPTRESAHETLDNPGVRDAGSIYVGTLERSNVNAEAEMADFEAARVALGRIRGMMGE